MRWAMRIFGAINVLVSLLSLCYFVWGIQIHIGKWPGHPNNFLWAIFIALSVTSTGVTAYVGYLGMQLIQNNNAVFAKLAWAFTAEVLFVFGDFWLTWIATPPAWPQDAMWFLGIALFPFDPQVLFGYAFAGIFAAIVMRWITRRSTGKRA